MSETFQFSEREARRMRRGVFLFPLLILSFAAILGSDSGKSQPAHFLIVFALGVIVSGVIVGVGWTGIQAQIRRARDTVLTVTPSRLAWSGPLGQTELLFDRVESVTVHRRRKTIHSVELKMSAGRTCRLEGYERMDRLVDTLKKHLPDNLFGG
ncbi:MAG: hypothetical protein OEY04_05410 [Gammaproteobacteria bacterium]|nr:hypothetical protein [Gammaproteobacteria bacterium]